MPQSPICVSCRTEMRVEDTGALVIVMAEFGPYTVWHADLYKCHGCGFEVVSACSFAERPILRSSDPDFDYMLEVEKSHARRVVYDYERPQSHNAEATH